MRNSVGAVRDVRAGVVARLRARRGELLEAIFVRVQAGALAAAGEMDAEYIAGLRAAVAAAVEYSLEGIEQGEEWVGPIPAAALEQVRRAARTGVSLDTVLRRYVVGNAFLGEVVLEEAGRGERSVLRGALRAQASVLDRLLDAVTVEYRDELARAGRSPEQRRAERVKRLLDGGGGGGDQRSELDYDLGAWHLGLIALGAGAADVVGELATALDCRLLSVAQGQQSVWAWLGGRERPVVEDVERALAHGIGGDAGVVLALGEPGRGVEAEEGLVLALGEPGRGIEGWRITHRQAQAAMLVALRKPQPQGVTRYVDVALLAFVLRDEVLAGALAELYLAPLDRQRDGGVVLRETLRAYFAAGRSASSAAAALGVARNTVENRLRTIEQSLGSALHTRVAELEVTLGLEELGEDGDRAGPSNEKRKP
jgi:hypothetical protein